MVSTRDGWSNQETLSETLSSSGSINDALGALRDLEGLTLNVPLEEVTAWRKSWYCAAETFFWDPSSSSSSEIDPSLNFSGFRAAEKSTGEASLLQDSDDDDLLMGECERVESLDSSFPLARLTGVLGRLSGVLERLTGVPALPGGVCTRSGWWSVSNGPGLGVRRCRTRVHPMHHESPHWHKVN